jgi:hypothetical protein
MHHIRTRIASRVRAVHSEVIDGFERNSHAIDRWSIESEARTLDQFGSHERREQTASEPGRHVPRKAVARHTRCESPYTAPSRTIARSTVSWKRATVSGSTTERCSRAMDWEDEAKSRPGSRCPRRAPQARHQGEQTGHPEVHAPDPKTERAVGTEVVDFSREPHRRHLGL